MYIEIVQLVTNTALGILILLVQQIIYPGFLFYKEAELKVWHKQYTKRIFYIIAPLMFMQLLAYSYAVVLDPWSINLIGILLIAVNWYVTFFIAVPLHQRIDNEQDTYQVRLKLIRVNWLRSVAWLLVWVLSLVEYGI